MEDELAEGNRDRYGDEPPLGQQDMSFLQVTAEELADAISGESVEEIKAAWFNIYDPMCSSNGQEYVMSPHSAGFYALLNDGKAVKVEVSMVTDPERLREIRNTFGYPQ